MDAGDESNLERGRSQCKYSAVGVCLWKEEQEAGVPGGPCAGERVREERPMRWGGGWRRWFRRALHASLRTLTFPLTDR